jgi:hypothetical protein
MDEASGIDWATRLRGWAVELGFASVGVADVDLRDAEPGLRARSARDRPSWCPARCAR